MARTPTGEVITPIRGQVLKTGPAGVRDIVDTRSKAYAQAFTGFNKSVVRLVDKLSKQGKSASEITQILGATDFAALARDNGIGRALKEIDAAYKEVLAATVGRHAITDSTLQALQSFTRDSFIADASAMPAKVKAEVMKSVMAGGRTSDVAKALMKETTRAHAETEAATGLSTFSRAVELEQAKLDPPDTTYLYEGPIDEITRDICLEMASAGALTLAEVEDQFPGAFIDGGGFNCRHQWIHADAAFEVDVDGAQNAIAAREEAGDWTTPQTVRERYGA